MYVSSSSLSMFHWLYGLIFLTVHVTFFSISCFVLLCFLKLCTLTGVQVCFTADFGIFVLQFLFWFATRSSPFYWQVLILKVFSLSCTTLVKSSTCSIFSSCISLTVYISHFSCISPWSSLPWLLYFQSIFPALLSPSVCSMQPVTSSWSRCQ